MATLSKTVLENIAEQMTKKSKEHVAALKKEYQQLATDLYKATIPEDVAACFKNHPSYFDTAGTVKANGHGFDYEHISIVGPNLVSNNGNYNVLLKLNAADGSKLWAAKVKYEKAQEKYKQLVQETEGALFALKTHKNIKENLPEAIPFLPPPMSNALVVNFNSLKKKLANQPTIETNVKA